MIHTVDCLLRKISVVSKPFLFSTEGNAFKLKLFFDAIKLTWSWSSSGTLLRGESRTETSGLRGGGWKGWCISIRDRKLKAEEE